tara:strand:- start:166 stop:402 length:237 start_codon:yes stop_codon:yes gene_type:complete
MSKVTHKTRVLDAMRNSTKGISPWYAINELGNTRLAATIYNLKKDGHEISSITEHSKNKFGDDVSYSRYFLIKEKTED